MWYWNSFVHNTYIYTHKNRPICISLPYYPRILQNDLVVFVFRIPFEFGPSTAAVYDNNLINIINRILCTSVLIFIAPPKVIVYVKVSPSHEIVITIIITENRETFFNFVANFKSFFFFFFTRVCFMKCVFY